jgi:phenylalanyl-tRNA synthetase beta chain
MLETGLETIAYNLNRQISSIALFEIGKVYGQSSKGAYYESEQLSIYLSGKQQQDGWRTKGILSDFFVAKGAATSIFNLLGMQGGAWKQTSTNQIDYVVNKKTTGSVQAIGSKKLQSFGIKQPVFYIQFDLANLFAIYQSKQVVYQEISKYPSVERDLALVIPQDTKYEAIEACVNEAKLEALKESRVFDIFESDKLGAQKKSVAINFVFNAPDKTLTDTEIDTMMKKLVQLFEKNLTAEVRK